MSGAESDLFEDVLFSHKFLSLSVGFTHYNVQHRLTAVDDVSHKENHVLQQFNGKPDEQNTINLKVVHKIYAFSPLSKLFGL